MSDVLVVGCGLLGTSVGLALQGSELADVTLWDDDEQAVALAARRGAGRAWDGREPAGVALVAVPPRATGRLLIELQSRQVAQTYTHVASVQSQVEAEVESLSPDPSWIVGGHPLAGREVSGGRGALADLFVGRPWAICARPTAAPEAVAAVERLAVLCGGVPVHVAPAAHDATVALLSHLPHLLSAALAGILVTDEGAQVPFDLSGPGLGDMTRLAAGNADLWTQILEANAAQVAPSVRLLAQALQGYAGVLERLAEKDLLQEDAQHARAELETLLRRGNAGRELVPVKRGEVAGAFAGVRVELRDEPGQLAGLLHAAGTAGVNVEDLRVEHVPGRPRGVVELLVAPGTAEQLADALRIGGWHLVMST